MCNVLSFLIMASTCVPLDTWGRLTYKLPSASGNLESADVKGNRFVIGRAKGCDLRIGLKMISGHHCYLSREGNDKIFLYDTSTNGTFVNENRVVNGQRGEVFDGDLLYLVRKKNPDSELNFHLVFKKRSNCNGSDSPNTKIEHQNKRLKVETDTAPSTSCEISKTNIVPIATDEGNDQETNNVVVIVQEEDETQEVQLIDVNDVPDEIIVSPEEVAGVSNTSDNTSSSQSMEDLLKCSLCLEIFHEPVCLQPCMHCYCSGCYSDWMTCSNECPQCRTPVQLLAKNHMISNLTEAFLRSHPEKRRSDSEIEILEGKNTITKDQLNSAKDSQCPSDCECDQCVQNSSSYSSGDNSPVPYNNKPMQRTCRECPGNASQNPNVSSKPGCSSAVQSTPFVCGPSQSHINCLCCFKQMPDRRQDQNANPQACELCTKTYCHMYWGCTQISCSGCLNKFADLKFTNNNLSNIVNENVVETRIVVDQAQSKGQSMQDVIKECFKRLDDKTYELTVNLSSSSILCYKCGLSNLRSLMYNYRRDIPTDELPNSVTSRQNCYWGVNCRTQKHNINHAQKLNHICNQTRF